MARTGQRITPRRVDMACAGQHMWPRRVDMARAGIISLATLNHATSSGSTVQVGFFDFFLATDIDRMYTTVLNAISEGGWSDHHDSDP